MFDPTGMARATGVQFAARASAIDPLQHWGKIHGDAILQNRMDYEHTAPELVRQLARLNDLLERLLVVQERGRPETDDGHA